MEQALLTQLLAMQCNIFHTPFYLYDKETRLEAFEPYPSPCDLVLPWLPTLQQTEDSLNYLLTKDFLLFGRILDLSSGLQVIVGPVRIGSITETTLHNVMLAARPAIGPEHIQEIGQFLNSCASFPPEQFLPILCLVHGYLNHKIITYKELMKKDAGKSILYDTNLRMISAVKEHTYGETVRRNNFDLESEIMFYISHGMTEKLKNMKFVRYDIGSLAFDSLRHYKNAIIILNTLSQRAAIIGGLDPETSYQLGEIYIQKIEACRDIDSLFSFSENIAVDYCERVERLLHPQTKHPKINEAMHFIRENYQKRLTVDEIAREVDLSSEYLSSKFRQVTGISLPTYINQQKIGEAKQLLHFTDMSLSEISVYLSFSSQSYFQTVFKNMTGDTPMEYRLKNKLFT
ncbi:MAG TPA: helix-turn-helix domain-containing protein [Clostridiales bacterium]|nr:helix-turn-helix domain-containing protein [Clostridiales bacterium]